MARKAAHTFTADIYIGGDVAIARNAIRRYTLEVGLCATLTPTDFIFTGGMETGMKVGLINYPRFPKEPRQIAAEAERLANYLRDSLCQHSYSIVMSDDTVWDSLRELP